jgi:hypothetical protein
VTHDEAKALGLRALECDGFRWMPGMLDTGNERMLKAVGPMWDDTGVEGAEPHSNYPPDFRDPATLGCLLALVRETWGEWAHLVPFATNVKDEEAGDLVPAMWWTLADIKKRRGILAGGEDDFPTYLAGQTQAEALVAALEAAP